MFNPADISRPPETSRQWVERISFWIYSNVIWAFLPLFLTFLFLLVFRLPLNISNELRISVPVLAMTLCGTQFVDDVKIPERFLTRWKWIKQSSNWILGVSTVALIANVIQERNISGLNISTSISSWIVFLSFLLSVSMGLWAFITRTQAMSETVEKSQSEETDTLIEASGKTNEINGVKL
ncbi:hypothetical protein [Paracoccus sp. PARArs4]|uniref:hypothetical protein n=1 Tax=Paracoccus sp. PARArs4 TaxID=2853442 RepID=UPI0024A72DB5|nr:hypothetical protein [Paracoccus sp. PARArs4]